MMLADYFLAGLAYTAISVIGVGIAITTWLRRARLVEIDSAPNLLLTIVAAGIYWSTVVFIGLFVARVHISLAVVLIKCGLEGAGFIVTVLILREQIGDLLKSLTSDAFTLLLSGAGFLLGTWAMLQFPHVLDSSQLAWTQQVIDGANGLPVSAMMGYSGVVVFLAAIFAGSPVVTTAAALKPLLFGIYGCLAVSLADCIDRKHRWFYALAFLALSLTSYFALYGLVQLGKDSVWGVLFALAFTASLCRAEEGGRPFEAALFFAVAAATGVIAVPYMLTVYALWLVLACPLPQVGRSLAAMAAVNFPTFSTVLAGYFGSGFFAVAAVYVAGAVLLLLAQRYAWPRLTAMLAHRSFAALPIVLPWIFVVPCVLLFPVELRYPVWANPDGSLVTEVRPPLDGHMRFFAYFLDPPVQRTTLALALVASLLIAFTPLAKRRPGFVAAAAAPFAVLLLGLLRAHSGLHIIKDFNVWDMVRDIPLWLGGTVFVFVLLAAVAGFGEWLGLPGRTRLIAPALIVIACLYTGKRSIAVSAYVAPVHYARYAAFSDRDMAEASSIVWQKFRGQMLWIDPTLAISRNYFYSFQMYGVRPAAFDAARLDSVLQRSDAKLLLVQNRTLPLLSDALAKRGGALEYLDVLQAEPASLVHVVNAGQGNASPPGGVVMPDRGNYDRERAGQVAFDWMRADAGISAVIPGTGVACVTLSLFESGLFTGPQTVRLTGAGIAPAEIDIAGHTLQNPARLRATIALQAGNAQLQLTAAGGERRFPNDPRQIAYGLRLPIDVAAGRECEK